MAVGHDYSLYSETQSGRVGVYGVLGIVAVVLVSALRYLIINHVVAPNESPPMWLFYVGAATPLVVFGLLVIAFDKYVWHWRLAKPIYVIARDKAPPYIHGEYVGTVSWRDKAGNCQKESEASVFIVQRWQKLVVTFEFLDSSRHKRAGSHSDMAFIQQGMHDEKPTLQYTYSYSGTEHAADGGVLTSIIHGTAILDFARQDGRWVITGRYYCDDGGSGRITLSMSGT